MASKCHNHTLQTNPRHCEEETQNILWWNKENGSKQALNACHTRRRFHRIATELFNFPEHRENARKSWYFSWKNVCHGVLTATKALPRSSHDVLSRSYGVHDGDSLRSHGAFTARPRRSKRMRRAFTALPLRWGRSDISKNSVQSPCKRHGRSRRLHNDPCVRPRSSYCVVGNLFVWLWWPYGVPSALY